MANETEKKTTEAVNKTESTPTAPKSDIFSEIGKTLTIQIATKVFGTDKALEAMQTVAQIGGHGLFEPHELASPLFGGLQLPDPEKIIKPKRTEFAAGPNGDYQFGLAEKTYQDQRTAAADAREKTKQALTDLKS